MRRTAIAYSLFALFFFSSCENIRELFPDESLTDEELYEEAIKDAMIADPDEISSNLIAITENNTYLTWRDNNGQPEVLVVTWTNHAERYTENTSMTNSWGEIWVTVVPELEDWLEVNKPAAEECVFRTEKLIGLPKNGGYSHFIEMWVSPDDLWRPTPDNEITDQTAQLDFPEETDSAYIDWFNNNILYSYYPKRYPWTRLGYTYDWDPSSSEVGLSEFIIKPNSHITVNQIIENEAFFAD